MIIKKDENTVLINGVERKDGEEFEVENNKFFYNLVKLKNIKCDCCKNFSNKIRFSLFLNNDYLKNSYVFCDNCLNKRELEVEQIDKFNFLNPHFSSSVTSSF